MSKPNQPSINRRDVLKSSAGALGAALVLGDSLEAYPKGGQHQFQPVRAEDHGHAHGHGREARTQSLPDHSDRYQSGRLWTWRSSRRRQSRPTLCCLKSRILGENPLQLDHIFRKIKQFGGTCAPGRRSVRCRDGACGTLPAKFTTRPFTPCWAAEVPRQDSRLCRHHGI